MVGSEGRQSLRKPALWGFVTFVQTIQQAYDPDGAQALARFQKDDPQSLRRGQRRLCPLWGFEILLNTLDDFWAIGESLPCPAPQDEHSTAPTLIVGAAEAVEEPTSLSWKVIRQLPSEKNREHRLALARASRYPEQWVSTFDPGKIRSISSDPLARTTGSGSLRADEGLTVDCRVAYEQRVTNPFAGIGRTLCTPICVVSLVSPIVLTLRTYPL